ncbi:MAG: cyclic nucleotide-binding domain-containing protein [Acidimicrobiales bacterium]
MATGVSKVDLSKIWLFSTCSDRNLRAIRKALVPEVVPPGRVLCKEGDTGREFFLIVDGRAAVKRHNRKTATLGPGQYFGELSLLDLRPRSATVVAETDMHLLVLGQRQFDELFDSIPALSKYLMAAMANRLRESDAKSFN